MISGAAPTAGAKLLGSAPVQQSAVGLMKNAAAMTPDEAMITLQQGRGLLTGANSRALSAEAKAAQTKTWRGTMEGVAQKHDAASQGAMSEALTRGAFGGAGGGLIRELTGSWMPSEAGAVIGAGTGRLGQSGAAQTLHALGNNPKSSDAFLRLVQEAVMNLLSPPQQQGVK
jgi:hypothetical protein